MFDDLVDCDIAHSLDSMARNIETSNCYNTGAGPFGGPDEGINMLGGIANDVGGIFSDAFDMTMKGRNFFGW